MQIDQVMRRAVSNHVSARSDYQRKRHHVRRYDTEHQPETCKDISGIVVIIRHGFGVSSLFQSRPSHVIDGERACHSFAFMFKYWTLALDVS
jgi:hypothetical protein